MSGSSIYRVFHNRTAQRNDTVPDVEGGHPWKLPSIRCVRCGTVFGKNSVIYPWVDLSDLPNRTVYKGNIVCVMPNLELATATEPVRALLPTGYDLPPGTSLGAYKGRHRTGVLEDFYFYREARFVSREAFVVLHAHGALGVGATPATIRGRKGAEVDYVELHLVPRATLAVPLVQSLGKRYCSECGFDQRSVPEPLVLDQASIPFGEQIFQLREKPYVILATSKFVEAVNDLRLTGIEFELVETAEITLGGIGIGRPTPVTTLPSNISDLPPSGGKSIPPKQVVSNTRSVEYCEWLNKAQSFHLETVKALGENAEASFISLPAANRKSITLIESTLGKFLPKTLREFFLEGTEALEMSYTWESNGPRSEVAQELFGSTTVYGDGTIRLSDQPTHREDCRGWAKETWLAEDLEQQEIWLRAVPFLRMDNGDYLAFDLRDEVENPGVIYLSHDDESRVIASSFADFLLAWERVCYIGPESWMLEPFLDPETGLLDGECENAQTLRQLLGVNDE